MEASPFKVNSKGQSFRRYSHRLLQVDLVEVATQ
jgi:hypothetical protein